MPDITDTGATTSGHDARGGRADGGGAQLTAATKREPAGISAPGLNYCSIRFVRELEQSNDALAGTAYRIVRQLGEGGMGEVYAVEHEVLGKEMVAKILRLDLASDPAVVDRMRVEAQALAALSHPNIVAVTDFGRTANGRPFYVMEYLRGRTVGQMLRRDGPASLIEALQIARQVLDALGAAHALGLVHRDIKPDNVFLHLLQDGREVVKLLDFGIAKVLASAGSRGPAPPSIPTADGTVLGTPRYVSPEQIVGRNIDHRSDLYAVGLLLYALIAGKSLFHSIHGTRELFEAHLKVKPPLLSDRNPEVSAELDRVVLRALEKRPDDRFRDALEFAEALAVVSRGLTRAVFAARPSPVAPLGQLHRTSDTLVDPTEPAPEGSEPTIRDKRELLDSNDSDGSLRTREGPAPRREPTEVLQHDAQHASPGAVSTRTARPQAPVEVAQPSPLPTPRAATAARNERLTIPYVVGAGVTALSMCILVFFVGLSSPVAIVLAAIGSTAAGTVLAMVLARRAA